MVKELFARQEVLKLTGLSSSQLSRLDKPEFVQPTKLGSKEHPVVLYKLNQVIELRVVAKLREHLSAQELKKVINYIQTNSFNESFANKYLVFCDDELCWADPSELFSKFVESKDDKPKAVVLKIVKPIGDIFSDLTIDNSQ